jgi:hypothetical protein
MPILGPENPQEAMEHGAIGYSTIPFHRNCFLFSFLLTFEIRILCAARGGAKSNLPQRRVLSVALHCSPDARHHNT